MCVGLSADTLRKKGVLLFHCSLAASRFESCTKRPFRGPCYTGDLLGKCATFEHARMAASRFESCMKRGGDGVIGCSEIWGTCIRYATSILHLPKLLSLAASAVFRSS